MKYLFLIGAFLVSAVAVKAQTLAEVINADGTLLVDVRSADEFAKGSVDGAINIPLEQVEKQIAKFKDTKAVVLFCRTGNRSGKAEALLKKKGIKAVNGKTVEMVKHLQKVNILSKVQYHTDKRSTWFVKDGKNIRQVAVALGEGAMLTKHNTKIPATLIMLKGSVRFVIEGEEVILNEFDTYQIPANIDHEVIGLTKENLFIVTKGE